MTELAHQIWKKHLSPDAVVIDATCGNGKDTLYLASLLDLQGSLYGYDIQESAILQTESLLKQTLSKEKQARIHLHLASHESFFEQEADLIVYNLGYLPGGQKNITTQTKVTLHSLSEALRILKPGGMISVMLYPGHEEGEKEEAAILDFASSLDSKWQVLHQKWLNRQKAPSLLLMQRSLDP